MSLVANLLVASLPCSKINGNHEITFNLHSLVKRYDIETVRVRYWNKVLIGQQIFMINGI